MTARNMQTSADTTSRSVPSAGNSLNFSNVLVAFCSSLQIKVNEFVFLSSDPLGLGEQKYNYQKPNEYIGQEMVQVNIKSEQNSPPTISGTCLFFNNVIIFRY
jgi:hypothetical protein